MVRKVGMETNNYCLYCMNEKAGTGDVCEHCGQISPKNQLGLIKAGSYLNNRYLVGRCIGQGGFGITYIGRDMVLDTRVAIKEYFPVEIASRNDEGTVSVSAGNPEYQAEFESGRTRFLQEARVLAKFKNDPWIVGVWDILTENNTVYIIMEYIDGVTLRQYVRQQGTMDFKTVYALLNPLMDTLEKMHAKGMIHRDISPSNIMLTGDGKVKLLDFGATKNFMNEGSRSIVLKPGFSPEEQYRSRAKLGPYTDVYAFCATIYFLLTGRAPDNAMTRIMDDDLQWPRTLGASIGEKEERALMKGMAVLAKDRIQSMSELKEAFRTGVPSSSDHMDEDDDERTIAVSRSGRQSYAAAAPDTRNEQSKVQAEPESKPQAEKESKPQAETESKPQPESKPEPERKPAKPLPKKERRPENQRRPEEEYEDRPIQKRSSHPGKMAFIPIIAIIAVIGIGIFMLLGRGVTGADGYVSGDTVVTFRDTTVTDKMIKSIRNSKKISAVNFSRCEISDEQIETLAELDGQVTSIDFNSCTGYTTLDPLAEMESLTDLEISGIDFDLLDNSGDYTLKGSTVFTKDFANLEELQLTNLEFGGDMTFLSHFPNLKGLSLNGQGVSDLDSLVCEDTMLSLSIYDTDLSQVNLEHLGGFIHMESISLDNCSCADVSWIADMNALRSIELSNNNLSSIPMLSAPDLYSIHVNDNQLTDLNWLPVQEESMLSVIYVNNNKVRDISALERVTDLSTFEANNNQISDISALADKKSLGVLSLDNNQITDADALSGDTALTTLHISNNQIENLDFCENTTTLTKLSAHHNAITDISGLTNTTQLEEAILSDNKITDASVLGKSAEHLEVVILDNNQISDISMLKGASALTALSIDNNKLTTLDGLESSASLYALSACGNELTDISALSGMMSLYLVDLGENQLTDISALSSVEVSKMALLVENNQISDISMLNVNCDYSYLSMYNNAIKDYTVLMGDSAIGSQDVLYASWDEKADLSGIGGSMYEYELNMVDVPLDQQQNLINSFAKAKEENQDRTYSQEPVFMTSEEADQKVDADRQELRKACGLVTDTDTGDEENTNE